MVGADLGLEAKDHLQKKLILFQDGQMSWLSSFCVIKGLFVQQLCPNEIAVHNDVLSSIYGNFTHKASEINTQIVVLISFFFTFVLCLVHEFGLAGDIHTHLRKSDLVSEGQVFSSQ